MYHNQSFLKSFMLKFKLYKNMYTFTLNNIFLWCVSIQFVVIINLISITNINTILKFKLFYILKTFSFIKLKTIHIFLLYLQLQT